MGRGEGECTMIARVWVWGLCGYVGGKLGWCGVVIWWCFV